MKQSQLFSKTSRDAPADEVSVNAKLLTRAGFIEKLMAGVYSYLPLGLRVIKNIENIIREEMNAIGGQELLLPAMHPKENWERTGRWKDPGREVMFQFPGRGDREYGLGWTHEEIITPLVKKFVHSHKDLPFSVYQIQTKFRDEPRAKSGLLRGREFLMKDLYSFHADEADLDRFYDIALVAYTKIFTRLGLQARVTEASGGVFSKYSHEFQVLTPAGEDIVILCDHCEFAQNREIVKLGNGEPCPKCKAPVRAERAIEVGNIFKLKTRFSQTFNLLYKNEHGKDLPVLMGCYGIGIGRSLGSIVEVYHDDKGILWPTAVAPFNVHLLALQDTPEVHKVADKIYASLQKLKIDVLYDDRAHASTGEKLNDADLIGIPVRLIVSEKTIAAESIEIKGRNERAGKLIKEKDLKKAIRDYVK